MGKRAGVIGLKLQRISFSLRRCRTEQSGYLNFRSIRIYPPGGLDARQPRAHMGRYPAPIGRCDPAVGQPTNGREIDEIILAIPLGIRYSTYIG